MIRYGAVVCLLLIFLLIPAWASQNSTNDLTINNTSVTNIPISPNSTSINITPFPKTDNQSSNINSEEFVKSGNAPSGTELASIRSAIVQSGATWVAADTPVSALPEEERVRLLGLKKPPSTRSSNQSLNQNVGTTGGYIETNLPVSLDWRNYSGQDWTTPIRDQQMCGSCWAFSTLGAVESRVKIGLNGSSLSPDYSEQELVSCAIALEGGTNGCDGAYLMTTPYNYMKQTGVVDESVFSYASYPSQAVYPPPCPGQTGYARHKIISYEELRDPDETTIKNALSKGPITATFDVYQDFYYYSHGIYQYTWGNYAGSHAVTMVGWGEDNTTGVPITYWICKNSWGPTFGEGGWFRIRSGSVGINDYLLEPTPELPPVSADFQGTILEGASPLNVSFVDESLNNPTSWQWNFGDGSANATTKNTTHLYIIPWELYCNSNGVEFLQFEHRTKNFLY